MIKQLSGECIIQDSEAFPVWSDITQSSSTYKSKQLTVCIELNKFDNKINFVPLNLQKRHKYKVDPHWLSIFVNIISLNIKMSKLPSKKQIHNHF